MIIERTYFDPKQTFECGQCFRWHLIDEVYLGVVDGALLAVTPHDKASYRVTVLAGDLSEDRLYDYFDMSVSYADVIGTLAHKDQWLEKATQQGSGIRLLNQDPFETLITFIISANNNIPKIKMAVEALSEKFGHYIGTHKGRPYYAFPTVEALEKAEVVDLQVKGMGYRSKSIYKAVAQITSGNLDLKTPYDLSFDDAKTWLMTLYGVGGKVADCVLLFAYGHKNAFPIDTWMKKVLLNYYGIDGSQKQVEAFAKSYFSEYAGYAQQYLFDFIRNENKTGRL
ncbi:DNA-3-methyladenine glycosylase family protein [Fusibacter tunisiensis]|uniref:DNA-(apurinic or apyrimidinic site) lyase n=1 Tax=Fusibacter tunisiensis TaxID=1008308 RepID=A0ABS2MPP7_9FIRM|nr:DNA glycosylase [Fusibacter tunisiensis]MBM7561365.1 N-glycosylase/DNA lyase [Fusibacter tunisiensis]